MSEVRNSAHFSFLPVSETDLTDVFALFDEIDAWLEAQLPHAMACAKSGLSVRFDEDFRMKADEERVAGRFDQWLEFESYRQDQIDNMDY